MAGTGLRHVSFLSDRARLPYRPEPGSALGSTWLGAREHQAHLVLFPTGGIWTLPRRAAAVTLQPTSSVSCDWPWFAFGHVVVVFFFGSTLREEYTIVIKYYGNILRALSQCRYFQPSLCKGDHKSSERLGELPKVTYGLGVESGPKPTQYDSRAQVPNACVLQCFCVARNGKQIIDGHSFCY